MQNKTTTINLEKRKNILDMFLATFSAFLFVSGLNQFNFFESKPESVKKGYGSSPYGG